MASQMETSGELKREENEDTVLSMVEVLQESEELEQEATAVLGDSDDRCCTYPLVCIHHFNLFHFKFCHELDAMFISTIPPSQ